MAETTEQVLKESGLEEVGHESHPKLGIDEIATIRRKEGHLESATGRISEAAEKTYHKTLETVADVKEKAIKFNEDIKPTIKFIGEAHKSYKEHQKEARAERLIDMDYKNKELTQQVSLQKLRNEMAQNQPKRNSLFSSSGQEQRSSSFGGGNGNIDFLYGSRPRAQQQQHGTSWWDNPAPRQEQPQTKKQIIVVGNRQYVSEVPIKQKQSREQNIPLAFQSESHSSNSMLDFMGKGKKVRWF